MYSKRNILLIYFFSEEASALVEKEGQKLEILKTLLSRIPLPDVNIKEAVKNIPNIDSRYDYISITNSSF